MYFQNISKMPISYVEDMIHTPILQDDTIDILERSEAFTLFVSLDYNFAVQPKFYYFVVMLIQRIVGKTHSSFLISCSTF